jgi:hypothetical protein
MKTIGAILLLIVICGYGDLPAESPDTKHTFDGRILAKLAGQSPYPFKIHKARPVDVSFVNPETNEEALQHWPQIEDANFFALPGADSFNEDFLAYGWAKPRENSGFFITDLQGNILLFEPYSKPSSFEAFDLQADGDLDILLHYRLYGNHGNGCERQAVCLNVGDKFIGAGTIVQSSDSLGQCERFGNITWVSDKLLCAVFKGEEVEVYARFRETIKTGEAYQVYEEYLLGELTMRLRTRTCDPIPTSRLQYVTFR